MKKMTSEKINIGTTSIGIQEPVFVIAEAGINHNGNLEIAKRLIQQACKNGANAIKFQTYITEKRVKKESPIFEMLKQCELSHDQQKELFSIAKEEGILFFSTAFDEESVDFLVSVGVPLMKVASFDITNLRLLRKIAGTSIPAIISCGMANEQEVDRAITFFRDTSTPLILLHCISSYPTNEEDANLNVISSIRAKYGFITGYSDHTFGIRVPVLAVAAGAAVIEKHFTLDRNMEGPDHSLSCDPNEMAEMVKQIRHTKKIMGESEIQMYEAEKATIIYRRITD